MSVLTFPTAQQLFWKYKHAKVPPFCCRQQKSRYLMHFLNFDKIVIVRARDAILGPLHEKQNIWARYPLHYQCMNGESWNLSHIIEHTSHAQLILFLTSQDYLEAQEK